MNICGHRHSVEHVGTITYLNGIPLCIPIVFHYISNYIYPVISFNPYGGFLSHGGTPNNHPCIHGFSMINYPFWGTTSICGNPHIYPILGYIYIYIDISDIIYIYIYIIPLIYIHDISIYIDIDLYSTVDFMTDPSVPYLAR